jgi:hypothetical protein
MNFTINTHGSTWKNPKTRAAIGIGGVALALSIAIGGISSLPSSSREASVTPAQIQSRPSTLFPLAADAVFALDSGVAISPTFANIVDAQEASIALAFAQPVPAAATELRDSALGLGQPGERSVVAPQFANMADAVYAASMADAVSAQEQILVALSQGGYAVAVPQFANMADAVYAASMADAVSAQEQILVALSQGGYAVAVPQFANMADAVYAASMVDTTSR